MTDIATKFNGFYAPLDDLDIVQKVEYVEGWERSGFDVWLPNDSGDFWVRTLINLGHTFTFFTETLPTPNWNEQMAYASANLVFFPVKSGELMLENINPGVEKFEFNEGNNTWHITSWMLKLLDGETHEVKLEGPPVNDDLICAFIEWTRTYVDENGVKKTETHETKYGWQWYRS